MNLDGLVDKIILKENLILVHSFPTNSILLKAAKDYLDEFFNVYFIDLPGFRKNIPALFKISFKEYANFVKNEIDKLKLEKFLLGGISFGFYVVNSIDIDNKCKAILAIEPYIGSKGLKMNIFKQEIIDEFLNDVIDMKLTDSIWKNGHLPKILKFLSGRTKREVSELLNQIDGNTFFKTAELILETHGPCRFKNVPYALIINPNDKTVNTDFILKTFKENVKDLFIIETKVEHYPKKMTVSYFEHKVNRLDVYKMIRWVNELYSRKKGVS